MIKLNLHVASVVVDNEEAKKQLWRLLAKNKVADRCAESWSPVQMHLGQEKYKKKREREKKTLTVYISRFRFSWDRGKQQ